MFYSYILPSCSVLNTIKLKGFVVESGETNKIHVYNVPKCFVLLLQSAIKCDLQTNATFFFCLSTMQFILTQCNLFCVTNNTFSGLFNRLQFLFCLIDSSSLMMNEKHNYYLRLINIKHVLYKKKKKKDWMSCTLL